MVVVSTSEDLRISRTSLKARMLYRFFFKKLRGVGFELSLDLLSSLRAKDEYELDDLPRGVLLQERPTRFTMLTPAVRAHT